MRRNHSTVELDDGTIDIYVRCSMCGEDKSVNAPVEQYDQWAGGELVQNAFPQMPRADRELLISATCGACFATLRGPDPGSAA